MLNLYPQLSDSSAQGTEKEILFPPNKVLILTEQEGNWQRFNLKTLARNNQTYRNRMRKKPGLKSALDTDDLWMPTNPRVGLAPKGTFNEMRLVTDFNDELRQLNHSHYQSVKR